MFYSYFIFFLYIGTTFAVFRSGYIAPGLQIWQSKTAEQCEEKFVDTKGIIRSHKSKDDIQTKWPTEKGQMTNNK
jgi:hypothetical protein